MISPLRGSTVHRNVFPHTVLHRITPLAIATLLASPVLAATIVGEAALVIGQATLSDAQGQATPLVRGMPVKVGDKIETQNGAHVYVRFVDGANLSIRPHSRMWIESYNHNPQQPQLGAIKLKLEEGSARSITGSWGEAARDRFRLSTPIAAIGVRGTDFSVNADAQATSASVYTGAIMVAPLSTACSPANTTCPQMPAVPLTADMRGQAIQISSFDRTPTVVTQVGFAGSVPRKTPGGALPEPSGLPTETGKPVTLTAAVDNTGERALGTFPSTFRQESWVVSTIDSAPTPPAPAPSPAPVAPPAPATPPVVQAPPTPVVPAVPEEPVTAVVVPPVPVGPPEVKQLQWTQYSWTPRFASSSFIGAFMDAYNAGLQKQMPTLATAFTLYGTGQTGLNAAQVPQEAVANFRLAHASAHFQSPFSWVSPEAVQVNGGQLAVDFTRQQFNTQLYMQGGPRVGTQVLDVSGVVSPQGQLIGNQGSFSVNGLLTSDRQEAAYGFEKPISSGSLVGVTLWGR